MAREPRKFEIAEAKRERVPLWVGLVGPSSSGKTKSALRLADGIRSVYGGDHYVIDTESKRALHYASDHKFKHVPFSAPFGSLDYLDCVRQCVASGASVVTIDSTSHEHEGEGGLLDLQEHELQRMAGDDFKRREAVKFAAWIKPKRYRVQLIQGLLTLPCNLIFCFRAREKIKPIKDANGKATFVQMGYQPIAGEEFIFEQTVSCLLLPKAEGVPTWHSAELGEKATIKLPGYLAHCFGKGPLDEETGRKLALWAKGDEQQKNSNVLPRNSVSGTGLRSYGVGSPATNGGGDLPSEDAGTSHESTAAYTDEDLVAQAKTYLEEEAKKGESTLRDVWRGLHQRYRDKLGKNGRCPQYLKDIAAEADKLRSVA